MKYSEVETKGKERILDLMKDMPLQVLHLAYLDAKYYMNFGVDITKALDTVTQNIATLEKAYKKGYYEGLNSARNNK